MTRTWASVTLGKLFGDDPTFGERVCMQLLTYVKMSIEFITEVKHLFDLELNNHQNQVHWVTNKIIVIVAIFVIPVCVQAFMMPYVHRASEALLDFIFERNLGLYNTEEMTIEDYAEIVRAVVLMDCLRRRMKNFKTRLMHRKVEEVARLDDEYQCSICYEAVEPGTIVTYLHPFCSHWFDTKCLIMWLKTQSTRPSCPMCRTEVNLDDRSIEETMEFWDRWYDWESDDHIIDETEWSIINGSADPWDIYQSLEE